MVIFTRDLVALVLFVMAVLKLVEMALGDFTPGGVALVVALFALAWWIKPDKDQRDNAHPFWEWLDFFTDLPYLAVTTVVKAVWRLLRLGDNDPSL